MSIKVRLIIMNFLQFFVWGSWLISLGGYMGRELHFEGGQIGAIFATMGIASLVMPGIIGIIADKWFNAERLYGLCHIAGAGCLFYASTATGYDQMYWAMLLDLDALVLFERKKMAIFFLFSMLLGAALQITNTYGDLFLGSFASIPEYADSFGVKHSVILLSISQMSETLFILAIPFFLRHFGIKQVMLISMFAWVFRFGPVRFWRSGIRTMDADPFHDCLWYGL